MPPKPTKQQSGRDKSDSPVSMSENTAANANDMKALADAVTAVQTSINSFREESRASIASLHSVLSVYGQRITDVEDGMKEFNKRLSSVETSQISLAKENDALKEKVAYLLHQTKLHQTAEYTYCGDTRRRGGPTTIRVYNWAAY